MRIALNVGINYYEHGNALFGCVDDAHAVKKVPNKTISSDRRMLRCAPHSAAGYGERQAAGAN